MRLAIVASFLRGIGSVVDLWPAPLPANRIGGGIVGRSDFEAMRGDCQAVASDFQACMTAERALVDQAVPVFLIKSVHIIEAKNGMTLKSLI